MPNFCPWVMGTLHLSDKNNKWKMKSNKATNVNEILSKLSIRDKCVQALNFHV